MTQIFSLKYIIFLAFFMFISPVFAQVVTIETPANNGNIKYGTISLGYTFTNTTPLDYCYYNFDNGNNVSLQIASDTINYWNFDEGSGTIAVDSSRNNNLTLSGDSWTAGYLNNAFYSNLTYYASNNTIWNTGVTENGTITFYMKPDGNIDKNNGTQYLWEKHVGDGGGLNLFVIILGGGNGIDFIKFVNGTDYHANWTEGTFTAETWYKITASWGTNGMYLYVDDDLKETNANTDIPHGTGSADFVFGYSLRSTDYFFDGAIDEAKLYDIQVSGANPNACVSGNITISKNELKKSWPIFVYTNDTSGIIYSANVNITTDTDYELKANSTTSTINTYSTIFTNTTATATKSTTTHSTFFNWSEIPIGSNVNITLVATGYNNYSFLQTFTNETFAFNNSYVMSEVTYTVNIFDEQNLSAILGNITISDGVSSVKYNDSSTYTLNYSDIPTGDITITVEADGYQNRLYYDSIISGISGSLNAYLLQTAEGLIVRFHVKDQNDQPVSNALVSSYLNGIIIEQDKTDSSGTATHFLDSEKTYNIFVSKSGYTTVNETINPTQQDYYITLPSIANVDFNNFWANIYFDFVPIGRYIRNGENSSINFSVSSINGDLGSFGLEIVNETGGTIFNQTLTTATGGTIYGFVNLSGYENNHQLKATGIINKNGYVSKRFDQYYYVIAEATGNYTLWRFFNKANTSLPDTAKLLIMIVITLLVAGFGAKFGGSKAGGIIMLAVLGMFTLVGWLIPEYYALIFFVVLGMVIAI